MDRREERDILRKGGLTEGEMKRLSQVRKIHRERMKLLKIEEQRRMEFIRWLVNTGKLTEQVAS